RNLQSKIGLVAARGRAKKCLLSKSTESSKTGRPIWKAGLVMKWTYPDMTNYWRKMKMDEELAKMLKYLRLGGLPAHWDEYLKVAQSRNFSHVRFLKYIVEEEYKLKSENSRKMRLKPWISTPLWEKSRFSKCR
ncbi:MAG: hypothetical protein QME81_19520, partial [bacterium]|nr:hypothetical protein [bacterium]